MIQEGINSFLIAGGSYAQWQQLLLCFGFGVLSSLTPCVYPLIPITIAVFGASECKTRREAFQLSSLYVCGIALSYTTLGVLSALSGAVFGQLLGNTWIVLLICVVLFILALAMLDIIPFRLGSTLQAKANRIGGRGALGALLMGAVSGVIAAPCTGPVLASILLVAASGGNVYWSAALLFSYSLGLGLIFVVLGTFSELLNRIPRSGPWLLYVKALLATLIFAVALSYGWPLVRSSGVESLILPAKSLALTLALVVGLTLLILASVRNLPLIKVISTFCLGLAIQLSMIGGDNLQEELIWHTSLESGLAQIKDRPSGILLVDLYADWCAACKEFDRITFRDSNVKKALSNLELARIDFTFGDEVTDAITERYKVLGLPTILFITSDAREISASRITGFLGPDEFLEHLKVLHSKR